ncbi:MAG TPA: bifunctional indole-3-glycerol phosphate synthase/phosphoribosylanthranilate isomerase, partial [Spirochaetota bacterium]|nr:bifunctional indole-3-glycerol phosphate synthase/phosphoribosylanthranilate isomerase [Spirochaetota bacterium]
VLEKMIKEANKFGMLPIVEIHNEEELKKISSLRLKIIGVNSRNLKDFKIDTNYPIGLRSRISNSEFTVFESGIKTYSDAFFAGCGGYDAILVGTSIIKGSDVGEKIRELKSGFINGINNRSKFYNVIFNKIYFEKKLIVKICGITNLKDAEFAVEKGADIIGFVFADSPRRISIENAKAIAEAIGDRALKVGVVVNDDIDKVVEAAREGWLDAIQFHGDTSDEDILSYNVCWYKAVRVRDQSDFEKKFSSPIILYDAYSEKEYGGTGKLINNENLLYAIERNILLCLAGGINVENILDIIKEYKPLMIDVSSGLESYAGVKDLKKMETFLDIIND